MLASPVQATVRPRIGPRCSSKVITSAITWQGCERLVRPLITGTVACAASSRQHLVVERADHDGVDIARQHARGVGDGLAAAELHLAGRSASWSRRRAAACRHRRRRACASTACRRSSPASCRRAALSAASRLRRSRLHGGARTDDRPAASARREVASDRGNDVAQRRLIRLLLAGRCALLRSRARRRRARARSMASRHLGFGDDQRRQQAHHVVAGRDDEQSCSARSASTKSAVRHHALAGRSGGPAPRTSAITPGWRSLSCGEPLLEKQPDAAAHARGSPARARRRAPRCRPPWRADCRRRSSHGCRPSCPSRLRAVARQAPIGKPPPMPLASRHDVGRDAEPLIGEELAGAARCRSAPRRRPAAGRARRRARAARAGTRGGTSRTPPSPWIGSIMIAAVSGPMARLDRLEIAERHLIEALDLRAEAFEIFLLPAGRDASPACGRGRRPRR